jgi:negative regulator of replication initiation
VRYIQIDIDEDIYKLLQKHARPFEDTPASTLRRLLKVDGPGAAGMVAHDASEPSCSTDGQNDHSASSAELRARQHAKAPKARLNELIRAGFLREGEELFLVDYQGTRRKHPKVTVAGTLLQLNAQRHSMSYLARELLKQAGFKSDFVRGPAHWVNAQEVSVKQMWEQLQAQQTTRQ